MFPRVTRSKTPFMASYKPFFGLALAMLLGSCVYVPPPEYYGGPPPPPGEPPPYHYDGPPPPGEPDYYFGRRGGRGYEFDYQQRRRGHTEYLREVDPAYAPEEEPVTGEGAMPPDGYPQPSTEPQPPTPPGPAPKLDPASVPYGTKTNTPGRAKSPYPPYRELDVSGMKSGSMAKDPTTGKVFRVP
jgi:hypothetical protein